jgi:hypothetical protein
MPVKPTTAAPTGGRDALSHVHAELGGYFSEVTAVPIVAPVLRISVGGLVTALEFDVTLTGSVRGIPGLEPFGLLVGPMGSIMRAGRSATVVPGGGRMIGRQTVETGT